VAILKRLREAVHRKRPELWPNDRILRHDNAPAHKALSVKQFLVQKSITKMEHPYYSPDLAPNDLWLFPKIKSALKGRKFQDVESIQKM
jgi:transposase